MGKTELSLELARRLNAEIISVDSRQVYRYLDVGTDKISPKIRKEIIHHAIDIKDPDERFTSADFVCTAKDAVRRIEARGKTPLLAGGSAFYYRALEGALSDALPENLEERAALEKRAALIGSAALHEELTKIDIVTADKIHPNDQYRIIRALEIYAATQEKPSELFAMREKLSGGFEIKYIGLVRERNILVQNIEARVRKQFENGYPEEVKWLLDNGYDEQLPAMQGFGYRELAAFWRGKMTLEEAALSDIKATKAFARRQMTWFKRFSPCTWYDMDAQKGDLIDAILKDFFNF